MMTQTETWWEPIFQGTMALGLNKNRINELEEESFLYFQPVEEELETN